MSAVLISVIAVALSLLATIVAARSEYVARAVKNGVEKAIEEHAQRIHAIQSCLICGEAMGEKDPHKRGTSIKKVQVQGFPFGMVPKTGRVHDECYQVHTGKAQVEVSA